jgi:hypothetical protein
MSENNCQKNETKSSENYKFRQRGKGRPMKNCIDRPNFPEVPRILMENEMRL